MAWSEVVFTKKVVKRRNTIIEAALGSPLARIIGFLSFSRTKMNHYGRVTIITTTIALTNSLPFVIC